ncbi:hypothetical protein HMSSN036_32160 [Paenibacillus macerans]|nr:hypothetical protein HMSSN036_32160 [Paenibacillus macerans]
MISVSRFENSIAESCRQAKSAMGVLLALKLPVRTIYYEQVPFLVNLSQVKLSADLHAVGKLEDSAELLETLRSFINNNCSVSLTAAELNIHRNTLQYRLKRIETVTGKDPRNVLQLFELIHGLLSLYS